MNVARLPWRGHGRPSGAVNARALRTVLLPVLAGSLALGVAVIGALITGGGSGTGGVNGFVESLSGSSSSRLGRALLVGLVVTGGFVLLFGIAGLVIGGGARAVVGIIPWLGLSVGVLLADVGAWTLGGGKLYTRFAGRAASRMGNPGQVGIRGYFLFGLSYDTASLSCTLPIFLTVVGTSLAVSNIPSALGQLFLYGLGMGAVIIALTIGMALFQGAMVGALRKTLGFVQRVSPVLMLVAGAYIVFYWLTIGGLW